MARTSIYALHDPRDWSIRYVGKADRPERRTLQHAKSTNARLRRFIAELRNLGFELKFSILCECSEDNWKHWERFWIETVRASGAEIFNLTRGGEGQPTDLESNEAKRVAHLGKKLSPEYCEAIRRGQTGKKYSPESRKKMSLARKGKKLSPETRQRMSVSRTGTKLSLEHRESISNALSGKSFSKSSVMKKNWQSLEFRNKVVSGVTKSWIKRREKE